MINDMLAIIWKEWLELIQQRGSTRSGLIGQLVFIGVFGVFFPLQFGTELIDSPFQLLIWSWVPFMLITAVIADSFAGERERHTLETLLASRLSDRAILFGKLATAISYGWGLTIVSVLLGVVTINVSHWQGHFIFYSPMILLGILAFSLLISLLASGLGVIISLRAATVRQAQQTFSIAFLLIFVPFFVLPYLPEAWMEGLMQIVLGADPTPIIVMAGLVLLVVDLALVGVAMARFKRSRLILD